MKQKAIFIGCYVGIILIGGIMGYLIANSRASLIASGVSAFLLLICATFIWKEKKVAYNMATCLITLLSVFFTYRFFLTSQLVPAGLMALLSGILCIYLFMQRKNLIAFSNS